MQTEERSLIAAMQTPAFLAKDGVVLCGNEALRALGLAEGTQLESVFAPEVCRPQSVPASFSCELFGRVYTLKIAAASDSLAYLLYRSEEPISGAALSSAGVSLRRAAQQLYTAAERLCGEEAEKGTPLNELIQGVFRVERIADCFDCLQSLLGGEYRLRTERYDLTGLLRGMLEHAQTLLRSAGIALRWTLPETPVFGNADEKLLSLIFWNLLEAAAHGETVSAVVERPRMTMLRLKLRGAQPTLPAGLRRDVGEEPGLKLAQAAAQLHGGGLVLSEEDGAFTAAVSLRTDLQANGLLRSDVQWNRHSLDAGLLALSELLPPEAYDSRDILG